jgi:hypothetical protein
MVTRIIKTYTYSRMTDFTPLAFGEQDENLDITNISSFDSTQRDVVPMFHANSSIDTLGAIAEEGFEEIYAGRPGEYLFSR